MDREELRVVERVRSVIDPDQEFSLLRIRQFLHAGVSEEAIIALVETQGYTPGLAGVFALHKKDRDRSKSIPECVELITRSEFHEVENLYEWVWDRCGPGIMAAMDEAFPGVGNQEPPFGLIDEVGYLVVNSPGVVVQHWDEKPDRVWILRRDVP